MQRGARLLPAHLPRSWHRASFWQSALVSMIA